MNYLLHIDTSTDAGMVAVGRDGVLIASRTNEETRNHASTINSMINDVLEDAGISLEQLSGISVCAGPGSYTGLRIGMATAKGLCYALDKPLLLANRLTLLACQEYYMYKHENAHYVSLLIAREKEYFISIYDKDFKCTLLPQHILEDQLPEIIGERENTHFITNVPDTALNTLKINKISVNSNIKIDSSVWISYTFEQFKCNDIVNLYLAEPFYLKQVYTHK